ncbi:S-layer homology domain-containing protein [Cohnella zeiphila]|uniref:S-layer homology domain-containing protein n=1 Tax=Cohnella zeiphila TaxID=2761120 RepID=A0A7X0VX88_9BACL|nr:S-layer homology domain-containing protein [Cohnella zeiphila]MBB6733192.1 S-layer homology domain-containing protein [Cohnella zeiphila]
MASVKKRTALPWKQKLSALMSAVIVAGSLAAAIPAPAAFAAGEGTGIKTSDGVTAFGASPVAIDPGLTIDLDSTIPLNGATVVIDTYQNGDTLTPPSTLPSGVSVARNEDGILIFSGDGSAEDYQTLLRSVAFSTNTADVAREVKFGLGSALPFKVNGEDHYYEFVDKGEENSITWSAARTEAESNDKKYFGRQGYLATITSSEENKFIAEKAQGLGWIGAADIVRLNDPNADVSSAGDWRWVTGPEGLEDNDKGLKFWQGYNIPPETGSVDDQYSNWNVGNSGYEPNNSGGEYVAHIFGLDPRNPDQLGKWNDFNPSNPDVTGYVIEYGGMPDDVNSIQITATKNIVALEPLKLVKVTVSNEEPNKATLTFNHPIDVNLTAEDFNGMKINGQTVTAVEIDGENVKVTLSEPLPPGNNYIAVEYDPSGGKIADKEHPENVLGKITADNQPVVDNGIVPLQLVTAKVEPNNKMRLVFNQDVDPDSIDLTGLTVAGKPVTGPFEFDGNEVVVNLPTGYKSGDKLAYEDAEPSNVHQAGNENNKLGDIAETDLPYPLNNPDGKLTNDGFGLVNGAQDIALEPAFDPNVPSGYVGNVPNEVASIGLSPEALNKDGTIVKVNLNGEEVAVGDWSKLPLQVGVNTIKVGIYDKNNPNVLLGEYTVTINRGYPPVVSAPSTPNVEKITVNVEASGHGVVAQTEIERTTNTDGTKSDKVTFETSKALEAVQKTLAAKAPAVRIVIPDAKDEVKDVRVDLPDAATKAVKDAGLDLEIYTDNGMITIPNASLGNLDPNLYFRLVPIKKEDERKQVEDRARTEQLVKDMMKGGNAYVVDRPMTIETNMSSRAVKITLPLSASHVPTDAKAKEAYLASLAVFVEHSDGTKELLKPTIGDYADGKLGLTISIGKFSTFTILNVDDGTNGNSGNGAEGSHQAYIVGLPDGTFGPNVAFTRAQVAAILSRVADLQTTGTAPSFPDVKAKHWASAAISKVAASGLMVGMPDGTFKPDQKISRAELAAIIARWKKLEGGTSTFADVKGHWAAGVIGEVQQAGYMEGMPNGSFQPNKVLTRAEGVTVFNRALGRGPLYGETKSTWSDVPMSHWAFYQIEEASQVHSYTSRPEGGETIVQ